MVGDYISRDYLLGEYDRQHQGPPGGARKIIADAPAADVVERPKWIPVTERLPDGDDIWGRVLVYTDEGRIQTAPKCKVGNGWITHWMTLPPPPESPKEEA